MAKPTPFRLFDRLAERAADKGLYLMADRSGGYHLSLDEAGKERQRKAESPPGMTSMNPCLVLTAVGIGAIRDYLDIHTGPHRVLPTAEILGIVWGTNPESSNDN